MLSFAAGVKYARSLALNAAPPAGCLAAEEY